MRYLVLIFAISHSLFSVEKPHLYSRYALLMDIDNGRVLYHKNGYDKIFPASTTKIATVLYLATHFSAHLNDEVVVSGDILKSVSHHHKKEQNYTLPAYWLQPDGTELGIKKGEKFPFKTLLYAALLISANDAANALAHHVMQDIPTFMEGLNQFLRTIGCQHTHFNNPHGLHHPEHYSTPYDMALMGRKAAQNALIREIALTEEYGKPGTKIVQKNRLLKEGPYYYPYAFGLKTGHTDPGKYNLVAAATDGKRNLVVALHKADKMSQCYRDAINLFEAYFAEEPVERLLFGKEDTFFSTVVKGAKKPLKAILENDVSIHYYPSEEPALKTEVVWENLALPIKQGAEVGELLVRDGDTVLTRSPIFASETLRRPLYYLLWAIPLCFPLLWYISRRASKESSPSRKV